MILFYFIFIAPKEVAGRIKHKYSLILEVFLLFSFLGVLLKRKMIEFI
jgi:hypothetical protein